MKPAPGNRVNKSTQRAHTSTKVRDNKYMGKATSFSFFFLYPQSDPKLSQNLMGFKTKAHFLFFFQRI